MVLVRTPQTQLQPRAKRTRAALLKAAEREFSTRGYATTTSKTIAKRAGVATGTFYVYFPDKDALLRELARQRQLSISDFALYALEDEVDVDANVLAIARARLTTVIDGVIAYHRSDVGLHTVLSERRHVDSELDQITSAAEAKLVKSISQLLQYWGNRGDCEATAFVLFGMVEGAVHAHVLGRPILSDERFSCALVDAALRVALGDRSESLQDSTAMAAGTRRSDAGAHTITTTKH